MIPYDDLVNALAAWRARQGLPVAQAAGAPAAPPPRAPAPPPPATRKSAQQPAARKSAQQPAARTAPPSAPPRAAAPREVNDFDEGEGAMVEEAAYDSGDDFAVPFGSAGIEAGESTAIGEAPEPPANVPMRGKRNPDW